MDFRGDPASALLEVLDPEQNNAFNDHYLDLDYDLSDVMFITTAEPAARDPAAAARSPARSSNSPGYTEWEKVAIAKQYLIKKQAEANGVHELGIVWTDEAKLTMIVHRYTKEGRRPEPRAGDCHDLPQDREGVARRRQAAEHRVHGEPRQARRVARRGEVPRDAPRAARTEIGLANGLAVTAFGGELLSTEITIVPGKGKLTLTGKLGSVMQESAQAAMSYFEIARQHVRHCPTTSRTRSTFTFTSPRARSRKMARRQASRWPWHRECAAADPGAPDHRDDRQRSHARPRAADRRPQGPSSRRTARASRLVLIPEENRKDVSDVPEGVLEQIAIIPVKHMDEVLRYALAHPHPEEFLREPSSVVDWRIVETMPPTDPRDAH